jgi:hypothetical protein
VTSFADDLPAGLDLGGLNATSDELADLLEVMSETDEEITMISNWGDGDDEELAGIEAPDGRPVQGQRGD